MLSLDDALANVLADLRPLPPERLALPDALFRVLAEDVTSGRELPPEDNSQMDGYAVRSADVAGAGPDTPVLLRVVGRVFAGERPAVQVGANEAVRIMTGATLPPGADAVVMQEQARAEGERVRVEHPARAGEYVRARGEDCRPGDRVLPAGALLGPGQLALLAAVGRTDVAVVQRPRVGILSTGDELCRVDEAPGGRIVDSNSWGLMGQVRAAGAVPIRLGFARDERGNIDRLLQAAERCDVVLSSAGVSVGEKDFVRDALEAAGVTLRFWKVAIRPGKPLVFGTRGPRVFFGLPGNPVSSMVTFEQFVRPALRRLMGHAEVRRPRLRAKLLAPVTKGAGLTHLLRAETSLSAGGLETRPLSKQGSGLVTSMAQANSFVVVPAEVTQLAPGAEVEVELFDGALGLSAVSCA